MKHNWKELNVYQPSWTILIQMVNELTLSPDLYLHFLLHEQDFNYLADAFPVLFSPQQSFPDFPLLFIHAWLPYPHLLHLLSFIPELTLIIEFCFQVQKQTML